MSELEQPDASRPGEAGSARSGDVIVQIKVKLLGVSKPPVWRRLQLRADTRLDHLHELIVAAFGWQDYHIALLRQRPRRIRSP
jgi:hypothetical protein